MALQRNGFPNYGNTCWANSIMQSLLSIQSFQEFLYKELYKEKDEDPKQLLFNFIKAISAYVYRRHEKNAMNNTLYGMIGFIFQKTELFEKYQQCDAHDFYIFLTDTLHEEIRRPLKRCVRMTNKKLDTSSIYYEAWQHRSQSLKKEYSFVNHYFHGISISTIACSCGYENNTYETFSTLQVPIPEDAKMTDTLSIYDLLENYSTVEILDDAKCEKCSETGNMYKEIRIAIAPKILAIQVKRFETIPTPRYHIRKNKVRISFPNFLELSKYDQILIPRDSRVGSYRKNCYQLRSIVHHTGSINSGHYFAQIRDQMDQDKWYICNDDRVIRFRTADRHPDGIPAVSPYIAFYESCSPDIVT